MTKTIALNRQFQEWSDKEKTDPELRWAFRIGHAQTWDDLLRERRVVLLAEAGSGKTEEMKERARILSASGEFAVYATVQDVGHRGLAGALRVNDRRRFEAWLASEQPGWFFIDSVDEAKLDGIQVDQALRRVATEIHGAEGRTHLILSGRLTDWEFRRDLQRLEEELPVPPVQPALPVLTPDEFVLRVIRHEKSTEDEQPTPRPIVVVMMPLDANRVREFAKGKGAKNLNDFIAQIELANLWRFAGRPLDLEWMVQFWARHQRLGSLAEMLENSLEERLRETDPSRSRRDALAGDRAMAALERIGAALVMGRARTIAIPDSEVTLASEAAPLDLHDVLPDWTADDVMRLLRKPVFDPATFGRARLHNDNEGVVSGYLAARWIKRLRAANLSLQDTFDLLFADTYGLPLVKRSMWETAAWIALSDEAVARDVLRRHSFLLLDQGDPESLPADLRRDILVQATELVATGVRAPFFDLDRIKSFSRPDIAATIRHLWSKHSASAEVRTFLLRFIWLGRLEACADIAVRAAFGDHSDDLTSLFGGRALVASANDATKRRYVAHLRSRVGEVRNAVIWDAIDDLFPALLSIDDLLFFVANTDVADRDGGIGLEWKGADLVERIPSRIDLERLLAGLLDQLGTTPLPIGHQPSSVEKAFFPAIGASALRLLQLSGPDEAPPVVLDAILRLGEFYRDRHATKAVDEATAELRRTPARRRAAFWRAATRLGRSSMLQGGILEFAWQMPFVGWSPGLKIEDLDWLLADAQEKRPVNQRRLAFNAALEIWRDAGSPSSLLPQIEAAAQNDANLGQVLQTWLTPRVRSPEELAREDEIAKLTRHGREQRDRQEHSWVQFAADLRANPEQLRALRPISATGVDGRLFDAWRLLRMASPQNTRYAIDSVAPLEPMIGYEAAVAVGDALISLWRRRRPQLRSTRAPDDRDLINNIDCIGIVGITLESNKQLDWAEHLTTDEARRAASYATLEIGGFPIWITTLARAKPREVAEVLAGEAAAEMDDPRPRPRSGTLDDIYRADATLSTLMAVPLLRELEQRASIAPVALAPTMGIIARGIDEENHHRFLELCLARFCDTANPETAALYIGPGFAIDAAAAIDALLSKLDRIEPDAQTALVQAILPQLFGDERFRHVGFAASLSFASLERLVQLAFRTIRIEDDRRHPSGEVFSPDGRDDAEHARGAAFKMLYETPGRATFDALNCFAQTPGFPIPMENLLHLAIERAELDSETAPWAPGDFKAFEQTCQTAPHTGRDLQLVALRRLADIQHDLLHGDFAQGSNVSSLPDERAAQNWVAERLRLAQGRSYSVEREPHVADEKEPDVRLRAKATDASNAIEIKVAESWTLEQLEFALTDQLCGRYLRAAKARHGILLLVHQKPRPRGWSVPGEQIALGFPQLVARLRERAVQIAGASPEAPQPEIAVLDVSTCAVPKTKNRRKVRQKSGVKTRPRKKRALLRNARRTSVHSSELLVPQAKTPQQVKKRRRRSRSPTAP